MSAISQAPISYLIRLGVERRGEEYLSFPQRALFDKIGIRTMVKSDPGATGHDLAISTCRTACGTANAFFPKALTQIAAFDPYPEAVVATAKNAREIVIDGRGLREMQRCI